MSKLLRQKWSGHIFPWSARLAERDDMEPYEPPPPPPPPAPPAPPAPAARSQPRAPKTPTQNPSSTPALPPLDDAIETFRQEVKQAFRRKGEA